MSRKVAVTGATGFIGRHIVRRLVAEGIAVKALARRDDADLRASGAIIVRGSLEDPPALAALIEDVDGIVHAAGAIRARSARDFIATNAEATGRLARLASQAGGTPRFLLLSSLAAREPGISSYAASKKAAETALADASDELLWTILRPPAVYGPGDRAILPLFRAMKHGFLPVPGDGGGRFSLIHVDDLAKAVLALLGGSMSDGQVLEIRDARADGYRWLDLVSPAEQAAGRRVRPLHVPSPLLRLTAAVSGTICGALGFAPAVTSGKVREILHRDWVCRGNPVADKTNWRPDVGLDAGFANTFSWYAENGWI